MNDIEKYGIVDVTYYENFFKDNDDWNNTFTQERNKKYEAHASTEVIPLQWSFENLNEKPSAEAPKTEFWDKYYNKEFFNTLSNILDETVGKGYPVRIVFAKLKAKSEIAKHRDLSTSLVANHRLHIPIVTNSKVIFGVRDQTVHMKQGEIFEINNFREHFVVNDSDQDRIHLIVDWHCTQ